ncbi:MULTISPECIES: sec-independent translocase [unclassified Streptomyces]|uniref:sec-independent translocase n=1 Tax=unclassified Streptomyces TaxID=2593676 RepID=UPI0038160080
MFTELSPMKLLAIAIVAIFVFGPDKLPEFIRNATGVLRKVRAFADSAKQDLRSELGPEFKDFEFEDLHPKTFVRKHVLDGADDLGLDKIRSALDLRPELEEVSGVVRDAAHGAGAGPAGSVAQPSAEHHANQPGAVSFTKGAEAAAPSHSVFDPDAT